MGLVITRFEATPNPDSMKVVLEPVDHAMLPKAPGTRWFPGPGEVVGAGAAASSSDALARAVLGVPGVASILIGAGWLTVSRAKHGGKGGEAASWSAIKRGVALAVAAASAGETCGGGG